MSRGEADDALYWVVRYLAEPILDWMSKHEEDPIRALNGSIEALPAPPDWEARLGKL